MIVVAAARAGRRRGASSAALARRAARAAPRASERRYRALAAQWPDLAIGADRPRPALRALRGRGARAHRLGARRGRRHDRSPTSSPPSGSPSCCRAVEARARGRARRARLGRRRARTRSSGSTSSPFREHGDEITHAMLAIRDIARGARAAALARGAARLPLRRARRSSASACASADADGAPARLRRRRPPDATTCTRSSGPSTSACAHPDGRPFGPHETPLLRALRGEEVARRRDARRRRRRHRRAARERRPGARPPTGAQLGAVVVNADLTDVPRRRGPPAPQRGAPPPRRRERRSTASSRPTRRAAGRTSPRPGRPPPGIAVEDSLGRPSLGVRAPRRPRRARPRLRAADGRRARRRCATRTASSPPPAPSAGARSRCARSAAGTACRPASSGVMRDVTDERRAQQHAAAEQRRDARC